MRNTIFYQHHHRLQERLSMQGHAFADIGVVDSSISTIATSGGRGFLMTMESRQYPGARRPAAIEDGNQ